MNTSADFSSESDNNIVVHPVMGTELSVGGLCLGGGEGALVVGWPPPP